MKIREILWSIGANSLNILIGIQMLIKIRGASRNRSLETWSEFFPHNRIWNPVKIASYNLAHINHWQWCFTLLYSIWQDVRMKANKETGLQKRALWRIVKNNNPDYIYRQCSSGGLSYLFRSSKTRGKDGGLLNPDSFASEKALTTPRLMAGDSKNPQTNLGTSRLSAPGRKKRKLERHGASQQRHASKMLTAQRSIVEPEADFGHERKYK